jgi:hypothetical protein
MRYCDDTIMFVRKAEQLEPHLANVFAPELDGLRREDRSGRHYYAYVEPFAIVFCGKTYRAVRIDVNAADHTASKPTRCFYDSESASEYLRQFGMVFDNREKRPGWRSLFTRPSVVEYLETPVNDHYAQFVLENRLPIVGLNYPERELFSKERPAVKNCILNKAEFYRVFDAHTAFQELSMYVGGVLPQQSAMVATVSDKDRIAQRGFDKWSFRKMPTKSQAKK